MSEAQKQRAAEVAAALKNIYQRARTGELKRATPVAVRPIRNNFLANRPAENG